MKVYGAMLGVDVQDDAFDGHAIVCPECKFDYVHPVAVETNAGGSVTRIDAGGTRMSAGSVRQRGVTIVVHFRCEDGHGFSAAFQFHKGMTFSTVRASDDPATETIWRD